MDKSKVPRFLAHPVYSPTAHCATLMSTLTADVFNRKLAQCQETFTIILVFYTFLFSTQGLRKTDKQTDEQDM